GAGTTVDLGGSVQGGDVGGGHLGLAVAEGRDLDVEGGGLLLFGRLPSEGGGQLVLDLLDLPSLPAHAPRHPVGVADAVVDGPADPVGGEGLEADPTPGVEPVDGVDEALGAVALEVIQLGLPGEGGRDVPGHVLDQGVVEVDQASPGGLATVLLERAPEPGGVVVGGVPGRSWLARTVDDGHDGRP